MESAIETPTGSNAGIQPNILRRLFARRRVSLLVALLLILFATRYALSPRGPSAYERWFASIAKNATIPTADLGDVPQADPEPQEEINIYAIGRVRGEEIRWQLQYLPDSKDHRALRILELAREAEAFPASQQLGPEEILPQRMTIGPQDSIALIVSTKEGGFKGEFGPAELSKNVKLATMLRLFENFAAQDEVKERY